MNDWHLVNLFIPTLLPLVFLAAFFLFELSKSEKARAHPLIAVKDGQLSWAGLGMCVNGLYELQHPAAGKVVLQSWNTNTFWLIIHTAISCLDRRGRPGFSYQEGRVYRMLENHPALPGVSCLSHPHDGRGMAVRGHTLDNAGLPS